MSVTKITIPMFKTSDGKIFEVLSDAEKHENSLLHQKYFIIRYGADLTEGRYHLRDKAYIRVVAKDHHYQFAKVLAASKFGSDYKFVMGVFGSNAILPYWELSTTECDGIDINDEVKFHVIDRWCSDPQGHDEGMWERVVEDGEINFVKIPLK